jgi:mono/diheme cytochrome c family protein
MKLIKGMFFLGFVLMSFQTKAQTGKSSTVTPLQASINRGKTVYLQQCLACHQVDGGGVPNLNPPLNGASAVRGKDKARLIRIVLKGMTDRVEIDGEEYSNNMAPHPELTDRQIADVLTYIRNSWSNKAIAVSAAEVKAVRAKLK